MNQKANLTILTTSCCTLKCKLCATYSSTNKHPHHYSCEDMLKGAERFFECMNEVRLFTLSGGEPFLHPQILDLINGCKKFADKMEKFEIITNGTIVPKDEILTALSDIPNVDIMIDDYGSELSYKADLLTEAFDKYNIKYRRRKYYGEDAHLGGWLDISDFTDKKRSDEENEQLFHKCMYSNVFDHHYFLIDGSIFMCYVNHKLLADINEKDDERVEILDEKLTVPEITKQLNELRNRRFLSVCPYCSGFLNDGKRYQPAEQLD